MRAKIPRVVADANVLWSPQLRNLLLQLAHQDLFRIYWTDLVVEEWLRNLAPEQRTRCEAGTVPLMQRHFPEAWLPVMAPTRFGTTDLKDCHVAAAAAHVAPSVLVTWNLKDFDREALHDHGVEVLSPDRFLIPPRLRTDAFGGARQARTGVGADAPDALASMCRCQGARV